MLERYRRHDESRTRGHMSIFFPRRARAVGTTNVSHSEKIEIVRSR